MKKARTKEIRRIAAADLGGVAAASGAVVDRVYLPERARRAQLFGGSPREAAAMLVDKLKFEARAL
jgi:electron transfer flavoprotein beta subunit